MVVVEKQPHRAEEPVATGWEARRLLARARAWAVEHPDAGWRVAPDEDDEPLS